MDDQTESQMLIRLGMRAMLAAVAVRPLTDKEAERIRLERSGYGEKAEWSASCSLDDGTVFVAMSGAAGSERFLRAGIAERARLAALDGVTTAVLVDGWL